MKRFLNIITRKYKDADGFIKAYENIHSRIAKSVDEYNDSLEEMGRYHYSDVSLTNGLKIIQNELNETGYQIDNVISAWVEKGDDTEWIGKYSHMLPKFTSLEFNEEMLSNEYVKLISFPSIEMDDLDTYASKLKSTLFEIQEQEEKNKKLELLVESLKTQNLDSSRFEKLMKVNDGALSDLKLIYAKELSNTKIMVDKTLNFLSMPNGIDLNTVAVHAYFRKLVETGFLSHTICFRRYVDNKPNIIAPYFEGLGLFFVNENKDNKTIENEEGSQIAC